MANSAFAPEITSKTRSLVPSNLQFSLYEALAPSFLGDFRGAGPIWRPAPLKFRAAYGTSTFLIVTLWLPASTPAWEKLPLALVVVVPPPLLSFTVLLASPTAFTEMLPE